MHSEFRDIEIIVETETNARFDGDIVQKFLTFEQVFQTREGADHIGQITFAGEQNGKRKGVIKTYERSRQYLWRFDNSIASCKMKIAEKISTSNTTTTIDKILREAKDELLRFSWPDTDDKNPRYSRRKCASGKFSGKNDDMAVAILMLNYYCIQRDSENKFLEYYHKNRQVDNTTPYDDYYQNYPKIGYSLM